MKKIPRALAELIDNFERLPGIGPKSASRLGFYLLSVPDDFSKNLAKSISELKIKLRFAKYVLGSERQKFVIFVGIKTVMKLKYV